LLRKSISTTKKKTPLSIDYAAQKLAKRKGSKKRKLGKSPSKLLTKHKKHQNLFKAAKSNKISIVQKGFQYSKRDVDIFDKQ